MEEPKNKKPKTYFQALSEEYGAYASSLREDHVVVVPVFNQMEVNTMNQDFFKMAREWPEYHHFADTKKEDSTRRVYGSFGAYGNPSSFHDPIVREWRRQIYERVSLPLFKIYEQESRKLEVLIDRLQQRRVYDDGIVKTETLGPDDWHRDESKNASAADEIFGGWVNLDVEDNQFFVCIKGTANEATANGKGFALLSKKEIKEQKFDERSATISIPPGHMIIFRQSILHKVLPQKLTSMPSIRMYMGHRLTNQNLPLYSDIFKRIQELAVPRIPSGQWPVMFSANHYQCADRIFRLAEITFVPEVLEKRLLDGTNNQYAVPGISQSYISHEKHKPEFFNATDKKSYYRTMKSLRSFVKNPRVLKKFEYEIHDLEMFKPQSLKDI